MEGERERDQRGVTGELCDYCLADGLIRACDDADEAVLITSCVSAVDFCRLGFTGPLQASRLHDRERKERSLQLGLAYLFRNSSRKRRVSQAGLTGGLLRRMMGRNAMMLEVRKSMAGLN